jgi:hypothetical protein
VPLIYGQWAFHLIRSEYKLALSLAEQFEKIGEMRNDVAVQLQGRRAQGVTRCYLREFVAARTFLRAVPWRWRASTSRHRRRTVL